jgi:hypothetical protein
MRQRIFLFIYMIFFMCAVVFAQETIFVSAGGDDNNSGLSEAEPKKTLKSALLLSGSSRIYRITVLGTLDYLSENSSENGAFYFNNISGLDRNTEVLIAGKPGASQTERAVLSAKNSGKIAVSIGDVNIRFENIEVSGAEGETSAGLAVAGTVTLGPGAVVRDNPIGVFLSGICTINGGEVLNNNGGGVIVSRYGILTLQNGAIRNNSKVGMMVEGNSTIDGGEVYDNNGTGIIVSRGGTLTMQSGAIRDNRSPSSAGGVAIMNGGRFTMTGGTITGNRAAQIAGGVLVMSGGRFSNNGGTISRNSAPQSPNTHRQ